MEFGVAPCYAEEQGSRTIDLRGVPLSKKHHKHHAAAPAAELRSRLERCRAEGRWQQGLDVAKQLYKAEAG